MPGHGDAGGGQPRAAYCSCLVSALGTGDSSSSSKTCMRKQGAARGASAPTWQQARAAALRCLQHTRQHDKRHACPNIPVAA